LPGLDAVSVVLLPLLWLVVILGGLVWKPESSIAAATTSSSPSSNPVSWSNDERPGMVAVEPSTAVF